MRMPLDQPDIGRTGRANLVAGRRQDLGVDLPLIGKANSCGAARIHLYIL